MPFMSRKKFDSTQKGPPRLKRSMCHKRSTSIPVQIDLIFNLEDGKRLFSTVHGNAKFAHPCIATRHSRGKRKQTCIQKANACDESTANKHHFLFNV